MDPVLLIIAG